MTMPPADDALRQQSLRGLGFFLVALAVIIFLPTWSLTFWQGWLYWLVFSAACVAITINLMRNDPELLRRRLEAGVGAERERTQKIIQGGASVAFLATYIVAGLDHHFGWTAVTDALAIVCDVLVAVGFFVVFLTFRENSFAAATIGVAPDQPVVATGPYAVVRHPMYAGAGLMILATPIALGSWWALIPAIALIGTIAVRLLDEERFLVLNLPGYARYRARTRFRLVPGVW